MDRCALFVDAGYLLADGAMAVHGTRHREAVSWDYPGLLQLLTNLARERTGLPLLRCYWYEATVEGRRTPEHDVLADIPGLKLRLARIRPGRREGVDAQVHRDLMTLARNNAVADAVVVSGDEDLAQVVSDAQDLGIRVTVISIASDGSWAVSRTLRQECDDLIEMSSGHLRPFVTLVTGADGVVSQNGSRHTGALPAVNGAQAALPPAPPPAAPPPAPAPQQQVPQPQSKGSHAAPPPRTPTYTYNPPPQEQPAPPPPPQPQYQGSHGSGSHSGDRGTGGYRESNTGSFPAAQLGPYTGPQAAPVSAAHGGATTTLADAVKAAHKEGHDFGDSIARDAPALWLEAVLARKPRMPSDLEARLLQGSSLPIDFLLHDEVRHALRRGFWDALERARR